MLHNTAQNINLASLTFWSNNWEYYTLILTCRKNHTFTNARSTKTTRYRKDKINSIIDAFIRDTKAKQAFRIS